MLTDTDRFITTLVFVPDIPTEWREQQTDGVAKISLTKPCLVPAPESQHLTRDKDGSSTVLPEMEQSPVKPAQCLRPFVTGRKFIDDNSNELTFIFVRLRHSVM